jgi:hypothetical protein
MTDMTNLHEVAAEVVDMNAGRAITYYVAFSVVKLKESSVPVGTEVWFRVGQSTLTVKGEVV